MSYFEVLAREHVKPVRQAPSKYHDWAVPTHRKSSFMRNGRNIVHFILTAVMAVWMFVLILPVPTFSAAVGYGWFANHWPWSEEAWAGLFAIAVIVGLAGAWARNRWIRLGAVTALGMAHGTIAYVILESDLQAHVMTTGPGVYSVLALAAAWRVLAEDWSYRW